MDTSKGSPRPLGDWPWIGLPHKNGDRLLGRENQRRVGDIWASGQAPVSILFRKSVTPLVAAIRVGDLLAVEFDGRYWWASSDDGVVGRLTWNVADETRVTWFDYVIDYPRRGELHVERLVVNAEGAVVNCNGFVTPSP